MSKKKDAERNKKINDFLKREDIAVLSGNIFGGMMIDTACTGVSCRVAEFCERYKRRFELTDWMAGHPHTIGGGPSKKCFAFIDIRHKPLQKTFDAED